VRLGGAYVDVELRGVDEANAKLNELNGKASVGGAGGAASRDLARGVKRLEGLTSAGSRGVIQQLTQLNRFASLIARYAGLTALGTGAGMLGRGLGIVRGLGLGSGAGAGAGGVSGAAVARALGLPSSSTSSAARTFEGMTRATRESILAEATTNIIPRRPATTTVIPASEAATRIIPRCLVDTAEWGALQGDESSLLPGTRLNTTLSPTRSMASEEALAEAFERADELTNSMEREAFRPPRLPPRPLELPSAGFGTAGIVAPGFQELSRVMDSLGAVARRALPALTGVGKAFLGIVGQFAVWFVIIVPIVAFFRNFNENMRYLGTALKMAGHLVKKLVDAFFALVPLDRWITRVFESIMDGMYLLSTFLRDLRLISKETYAELLNMYRSGLQPQGALARVASIAGTFTGAAVAQLAGVTYDKRQLDELIRIRRGVEKGGSPKRSY